MNAEFEKWRKEREDHLRYVAFRNWAPVDFEAAFVAGAAEKEAELRAEIDKLKAQMSEDAITYADYAERLKAQTANALEMAAELCKEHWHYHQRIRSLITTDQAAALARREAKVRLEEAEWWNERLERVRAAHAPESIGPYSHELQRLAELRAAAGEKEADRERT